MSPEDIINGWGEQYQKIISSKHKNVGNNLNKIKELKQKIVVWLGGPGNGATLYCYRQLIRRLLEKENFDVIFSEEYKHGEDLATKERIEATSSDLVILMALSPGSSAECIEFANIEEIKKKMYMYIPEQYKDGYVFRSLHGIHSLIREDSKFSLEKFKNYDSELPLKILDTATNQRFKKFSHSQLMEELGTAIRP